MSQITKQDLVFDPSIAQFNAMRTGKPLTTLAGANNTGKSIVLKYLKQQVGRTAYLIGPARFYHVHQFSSGVRNPRELDEFENQFNQNFSQEQYNYENNLLDLNRIIIGLSNRTRDQLFGLCGDLIGCKLTLKKVDEDNDLSVRYVDMDGQNISVGSTGTRLLLTMLGICLDDRFSTMLIDEPELGLSPKVQKALLTFIADPTERAKYFPHLATVYIATHSHLFLNRTDLSSNYVVSKENANIRLNQVKTISDFHRLQFNLLGNSLESLFLPAAIIIVEGKTDYDYIDRLIALQLSDKKISVISANGDGEIKRRVHGLRDAFGDLSRSPLRSRIFVVLDKKHQLGLTSELAAKFGLLPSNIVTWERNGIEYLYPPALLSTIFACSHDDIAELCIDEDNVSFSGIRKRKTDLSAEVIARLDSGTELPEEIMAKLLTPIRFATT